MQSSCQDMPVSSALGAKDEEPNANCLVLISEKAH